MKLKTLAIATAFTLSASALSWAGYTYIKPRAAASGVKEGDKQKPVSDLFALKELAALLNTYSKAGTIEASFNTMLMSEDGQTVLESFEGRYIKDSVNLYIQSYGSENLLNKDFLVAVDHDEKMLFVEKSSPGQMPGLLQQAFLGDIDSLVNFPDSLVFYEKLDENTAKLTFAVPAGNYYKTEYIYDIRSKHLKRLHLYPYREIFEQVPEQGEIGTDAIIRDFKPSSETEKGKAGYVAIVYTELLIDKPLSRKWFDHSRYFTIQNAKPVLTNKFKTYEIDFE